jgi:hypothetical protein
MIFGPGTPGGNAAVGVVSYRRLDRLGPEQVRSGLGGFTKTSMVPQSPLDSGFVDTSVDTVGGAEYP